MNKKNVDIQNHSSAQNLSVQKQKEHTIWSLKPQHWKKNSSSKFKKWMMESFESSFFRITYAQNGKNTNPKSIHKFVRLTLFILTLLSLSISSSSFHHFISQCSAVYRTQKAHINCSNGGHWRAFNIKQTCHLT